MSLTVSKSKAKKAKKAEPDFFCPYCKKSFVSETTVMKHMCFKKEREMEKEEKHIRLACQVYQQFFKINQRSEKNWSDFRDSKFYNDFVKVGRYIVDTNPINPSLFIDFLVRSNRPVKDWTGSFMYEIYIKETIKKETPCAAAERNILLMQQWADSTGNNWNDFFRKIAPPQATMWIKSGRISPWVLYICDSAEELMIRMSPEQMEMVKANLDPGFWSLKMERHPEDVKYLKQIFADMGL